ncbi:MAG: 8-amino-7-oxononanoate synthase [Kiritimatiellae bacterium]|nr:8-amino-7-oxononanoate synthase [Kiritimatiellia bacterium]
MKGSSGLFSVKMRASCSRRHISGAEKIVPPHAVPHTVSQLAERALNHPKGVPDFINIKIENPGAIVRLEALPVVTERTSTPDEGLARAASLLKEAGVLRMDEIMALFRETYSMRGAMLLDADTLERLEPDRERGVRATCMDDSDSILKGTAGGKNHYAEAIVLATKVANAPGIVGEICVSDDPDYVTGYVATRNIGYRRITVIKEKGDPAGGRIFLYRGRREDVASTIRFLEKTPVVVEGVPVLGAVAEERRMDGLAAEMSVIDSAGLRRGIRVLDSPAGPEALAGCRRLAVLSSNDYLDLARDPRVTAAASGASAKWGAGSGGSRLTTGTQPPHVALERHLASFKGTDDAVLFATGYMANVGTIQALVKKGDAIVSDELNHASIIDGCRLSGADVIVYRHGDMDDLARKLSFCREHRRRLAVSDAVFSMDGDMLDLPRFLDVCSANDAFSMIDEAHSTGVAGATGRGLVEHFGCGHPDILLGTLSKALGSAGGFVCCSGEIADFLRNRARSFIFSTSPCPAAAAAADAALTVLENEPWRVEKLRENVGFFTRELARRGISAKSPSAIVPIPVGDERRAMAAASALEESGFLVPAIRYPAVPMGAARLRVALMSSHTRETLSSAAEAIARALGNLV